MNEFVPSEFYLGQNYPNPFEDKTIIKYCIAFKTIVKLKVYNSDGKVIEKLIDEEKKPGTYEIEFNASACHSCESRKLQEGTYFYRLEAGDYTSEKKMVLQK
jgi:5-hydroxyisourate hydrolase-like protein (transthyretin family)